MFGFTDTLRTFGVFPLAGLTASQLPPELVLGVAVKLSAPPLLAKATVFATGGDPPVWNVKAKETGFSERDGAVIVSVTGIVWELAPLAAEGVTITQPA